MNSFPWVWQRLFNFNSPMFSCREFVCRNAKKLIPVLAATAVSVVCLPLFSQASQSTTPGAVFDQSGSVVAGTSVTVIDVARGAHASLSYRQRWAVRGQQCGSGHLYSARRGQSGPFSAFTSRPTSIPCFAPTGGKLAGCTAYHVVNGVPTPPAACMAAATAPYAGNAQLQSLALASLQNFGCYVENGGVLTPPVYGTVGNTGKNNFRGPHYYNMYFSVAKIWKFRDPIAHSCA